MVYVIFCQRPQSYSKLLKFKSFLYRNINVFAKINKFKENLSIQVMYVCER